MKSLAGVLLGPRQFELQELPIPNPLPPGHGLLRVEATGLCGSDWAAYSGERRDLNFPLVRGHEVVGFIERLDSEMAASWNLREGDRVALEPAQHCGACGPCKLGRIKACLNRRSYGAELSTRDGCGLWGGMSQYMVLHPQTTFYNVPAELSTEDAALFNPLGNALHWVVERVEVGVGDRVLIMGAGQRGLLCALAARASGASQVILTGLDRDKPKFDIAAQFGATDLVNAARENVVERVRELTAGAGVDKALDLVPVASHTILDGIRALRLGGILGLAGMKAGLIEGLDTNEIWKKDLTVRGMSTVSPWASEQALETLAAQAYPFALLHTHRFGLDKLDYAHRLLGNEVKDDSAIHITITPNS